MIPNLRKVFNEGFVESKYHEFLTVLGAGCKDNISFRNCETPCFLPKALLDKMVAYGQELILQLTDNKEYLASAQATIPSQFSIPNVDNKPLFIQVDFGLDENLEPKLVEIQGFPSLYAYQPYLAETYRSVYGLGDDLSSFIGSLTRNSYEDLLRQAIVGNHDPENVILLEIHPETQKTWCDFYLTEQICGIKTVCLTQVEKQGKQLFYRSEGKLIPIARIYNRVIVDELIRKGVSAQFDLRSELDVEWAGHPAWYYKISKYSLPFLNHVSVPKTWFLNELENIPHDLENYVLKPLFSFAGQGVSVGPSQDEVMAVRNSKEMVLQQRVQFAATIETPYGLTKAEFRIMYIWLDELQPVTTLLRMGRGKMMGVDQNRDMKWVGASAVFTPTQD